MMPELSWSWAALLLLGATHGINPGMGWLFAVGLGLQDQDRRAVWRALGPLAAGHALAVAAAVAVAALLGRVIPLDVVKWLVAASLTVMGVRLMLGHRHVRFGGMRVTGRELTMWSFLMASAHGAGLMVVPFLMRVVRPAALGGAPHAGHMAHSAQMASVIPPVPAAGLAVALIHTAGYLIVTGVIAVVVYERLGLRLLGKAWFNVDRLWAGALIVTAVLTPVVAGR